MPRIPPARRNRRFLLALLGSLVGSGLLWAVLLAGQLGSPPAATAWVEQAYAHKLARAAAIDGPRLLIVGGSGAMFGLDSARLEEALGRPTINLGVNAGIQSLFISAYARQAIRPGDWVLLPLEYPLYHDHQRINYATLDYWLSHPGARQLGLTAWQAAQLYWQISLARLLRGYRPVPAEISAGLYGPHNLDERGDQRGNEAANQAVWMREAVERSAAERYSEGVSDFQASWSRWRELAEHIDGLGGCAVFIPAALLQRAQYLKGRERDYYQRLPERARRAGLRYVGEPHAFFYPQEDFFDTNYHLNAEARTRHTERVIALVQPVFRACR